MITPMRKVTLLCLAAEREEAVNALREVGVLHVRHRAGDQAGAAPSEETAARREALLRALGILSALPPPERTPAAPANSSVEEPAGTAGGVEVLAERIATLQSRRAALDEQEEDLRFEREALLPLGDFDPRQVADLERRGVRLQLFRLPLKTPFPGGEGVARIYAWDGYQYGVAFNARPAAEGLEDLPLPQRSLSTVEAQLRETEAQRHSALRELHALAEHVPALEARAAELEEVLAFQRVGESMASHGAVADLEGFCPVSKVPLLREAARRQGWALWLRDPGPGENVPVALDLPRWLRPIAVLFKGLGILPGYREADVSAVFLVFFSLFFAMLIGDAGYGLLMLAGVLFARRRKPKAPSQPFWLFGVFAVATIVWGGLTGNYFAIDRALLPRGLQGLDWLRVNDHVMWLCFLIGGAHLTIAHLWNAAVLLPSRKALAQVGWIGVVWLMFSIAGNLVVARPIPPAVPWIGGAGILLIALFMTDPKDFKEEWINHPMLMLNLISCLVDVISYIRLFAVGMASAQIAMNFNQMALGLPLPAWVKPLGVALILILGHGLNLVLGALSILVHAVRLNTLEFSNHKGLSWSGQPYTPFRRKELPFNA